MPHCFDAQPLTRSGQPNAQDRARATPTQAAGMRNMSHLRSAAHDAVGVRLGARGQRLQPLGILQQQLEALLRFRNARKLRDGHIQLQAGRLRLRLGARSDLPRQ